MLGSERFRLEGRRLFLGLFISLFWWSPAFADLTGDVGGTVFDGTGSAVPGARVTISHLDTGTHRSFITDPAGRFMFQQLPLGTYEVRIEAQAFKPYSVRVVSKSGEKANLNIVLEVGEIPPTQLEVASEAPQILDTAGAQRQISVEEKRIKELPLLTRDPLLLAGLSAGVVPVTPNNPLLNSGSPNVNGGRGRAVNITIDGVTATDVTTTGSAGFSALSLDSIQEFKLITHNPDAELGRNASAQMQIITKSGTNQVHGTVFEYLQNSAFNARDYFDTTGHAASIRRNQYGVTLGGPLRKDRTFLFGHWEGLQIRGLGGTQVARVPTPEDVDRITDSTSRELFQRFQIPTSPTRVISNTANNVTKQESFSIRLDHRIGESDRVMGRFAWAETDSVSEASTFVGTGLKNFGYKSVNGPRQVTVGHTHVLRPEMVNEFRLGYGRSAPQFPLNSTVPLGPRIFITGFSEWGQSNSFPSGRVQNTFQYLDTFSWVHGPHSVKMGADFHRIQANSFFDVSVRGTAFFIDFPSYAAGRPFRWIQTFGDSVRGHRVSNQYFFIQDDFKVRPDLTVNIGLRLEVSGGVSEINGKMSNLDLSRPAPIGGAGPGPLGSLVLGGAASNRNVNWEPRVGLAWNPGRGRWVLRTGYGMTHDFIFLNPVTNARFSPPFITTLDFPGSFTGVNDWEHLVAGTADIQNMVRAGLGRLDPTFTNFGTLGVIDRGLRNPRVQQWNLGVQREITPTLVIQASYVGARSDRLLRNRQINPIRPELVIPATSEADESARLAQFQAISRASTAPPTGSSNRIDPRFNSVSLLESASRSIYHGFQLEVVKRLSRIYQFQASYTLSKSIDDGSDALNILVNDSAIQQNPFNMRGERAVSQFDIPQRFVMNHTVEFPWAQGLSGLPQKLLDGWVWSGIFQIQSGFPATIYAGTRYAIADSSLLGGGNVRPNLSGPRWDFTPVPRGSPTAAIPMPCERGVSTTVSPPCPNSSGFPLTQPLLGHVGNLGRNTLRLNRLQQFDWVFIKNTSLGESKVIQFRVEIFNVFNTPTFSKFVNNLTSSDFGLYTGTDIPARKIQFGVKYIF